MAADCVSSSFDFFTALFLGFCPSVCLSVCLFVCLLGITKRSRYQGVAIETRFPFYAFTGLCWGAFFAHVGSSWRSWAPSWLILALLGRILSPRWRNIAPRWPKIAHLVAKMRQHSPTWPPHGSRWTPRPPKQF